MSQQQCCKCNQWKPLSEFHRESRRSSGYRADCKECRRPVSQRHYRANRTNIIEYQREYRRSNKEVVNFKDRKRYERERDHRIAYQSQYVKDNPDVPYRARAKRRAARSIPFTGEQLAQRIAYYGHRCWICREASYQELDHVKPLSKGGIHMLANLRPACVSCNRRKHASWPPRVR